MKSFASDNYSGIHPEILEAIQHANQLHEISYAEDTYTEKQMRFFAKYSELIQKYFMLSTAPEPMLSH
jgi:threonine aldolase